MTARVGRLTVMPWSPLGEESTILVDAASAPKAHAASAPSEDPSSSAASARSKIRGAPILPLNTCAPKRRAPSGTSHPAPISNGASTWASPPGAASPVPRVSIGSIGVKRARRCVTVAVTPSKVAATKVHSFA